MTRMAVDQEWLYFDIKERLAELHVPAPTGLSKWRGRDLGALILLLTGCSVILATVPNHLFAPQTLTITYTLGLLAIWRFGWWFNHARRSEKFMRQKWPRVRDRRDATWDAGWRPRHLHVQMTTFHEEPAITRHVMASLFSQIRAERIPATIWVGTGSASDEIIITEVAEDLAGDLDVDVVFLRQNQPGKRMAIGIVMRAIIRTAPDPDDLIIFMDGDTVLGEHTLARCCGMFGADRDLEALTTDEQVVTYGVGWVRRWLDLRFAQRRLAMQSHVMSDKVLTLTGRMSMFRAHLITNEKFVRTIEADYLDHWLWGRFRFLSGDDKSTWYHMLTHRAKMGYVPDACVYTVEIIDGLGIQRMVQNLRRWSGNMLRNGSRALALGPARMGLFIWWCVLDQRIAIWTMLVSPTLVMIALFLEPGYFVGAALWVVLSRLVLSLYLFRYARSVDMTWPFILYANQLVNACVKAVLQFFPQKQTWANRGGQRTGFGQTTADRLKGWVASAQLVTAMSAFVAVVAWLSGRTDGFGLF